MSMHSKKKPESKCKINSVEATDEQITGRGGLSLFVRYLDRIGIFYQFLLPVFGNLRRSKKGASVYDIFMQLFAFFIDGTSRHLSYFDHLKQDEAYARTIESDPAALVSSHTVKRFFQAFSWPLIWSFRGVLLKIFIWRLSIIKPELVKIDLDAMVMDNDQAEKREGVKPTYNKVKSNLSPNSLFLDIQPPGAVTPRGCRFGRKKNEQKEFRRDQEKSKDQCFELDPGH